MGCVSSVLYVIDLLVSESGTLLATSVRPVRRARMFFMAAWRGGAKRWLGLAVVLLVLGLGAGCGPSDSFHRTEVTTPAAEQGLPFHPAADQSSASDGRAPAAVPEAKPGGFVPFHGSQPRIVPSGTLLTVQLDNTLSSSKVRSGDTFTAVVASPLTIDGETLIERGAVVTGHVESARTETDIPGLNPASGYFRVSLSAITLGGKSVALQTSSLYARGVVQHSNAISVPKGRHLTFRLTAPVSVDDPKAVATR